MQDQLNFGMPPIIWPTYRKPYPDWVDQAYPWPRRYKDALESGQITFESKKMMAVDQNPYLQSIDVNMVILNLDKFGLPRFKLAVDNGEDEARPSAFEYLKEKAKLWANNYLLANEFENNEHDEEMMEENEEATCTLECREGKSTADQVIHSNDEAEDDGMTDIEEEIDLEAERRIRGVSYKNLLK
ncbi:putative retroelement [Abeliophyllum distichum]|uniref:Retroelement n=1 Tax=Abeliophyllum distichum TaxID=126358 RepID=A0ABD1RUR8_9LAMI